MPVASEKLLTSPMELWVVVVFIVCGVCAGGSFLSALTLAIRHAKAGRKITGSVTPSSRSVLYIDMVASIPVFACFSLFALLTVELAPVWHFLLTLVLAATFRKVPTTFLNLVGGAVRMQLLLNERIKDGMNGPVHLYGLPPCCCARLCIKPKPIQATEFPKLRLGVIQFCVLQPLLSLVDLVVQMEYLMGASFVTWISRQRALMVILKLLSNFACQSSCKGLALLIETLNPTSAKNLHLSSKLSYCRTFLFGLNLLPMLMGLLVNSTVTLEAYSLRNGFKMSEIEIGNMVHSITTCLATLVCTKFAWKAFPVDKVHYPELSFSGGHPDIFQPLVDMTLKHVEYCPFCGSSDLATECDTVAVVTARCSDCNVGAIPAELSTR